MKLSLNWKINGFITLVISCVLLISGGYEITQSWQRLVANLEEDANILVERLALSLVGPMWSFDDENIWSSIHSEMQTPDILAIVVERPVGHITTFVITRNQNWETVEFTEAKPIQGFIQKQRDIVRDDELLGQVTIYMTDRFIKQTYQTEVIDLFVRTVVLLGVIIFTLFILIQQIIVKPLTTLTNSSKIIADGNLDALIPVKRSDEIGVLANSFEVMRTAIKKQITVLNEEIMERKRVEAEVRELNETLEQRVVLRTQRLAAIAALSEHLNALLDFDQLLQDLVHEVKTQFDFYQVQVYMLETSAAEAQLVIAAGTDVAGEMMMKQSHAIPLTASVSLVAMAARSGNVVVVDDVYKNKMWLANPLLPDTKSEMVVPIIREEQVVGVLDMQSNQIAYFDEEDANLLRSLANQVAVAITNAQLFAQNQTRLQETETLYTISQRMLTATSLPELIAALVEEVNIPVINRAVLGIFEYNEQNRMIAMTIKANWYSGHGTEPTPPGVRYGQEVIQTLNHFLSPEPVFFEDTQQDERFDLNGQAIVKNINIRALMVLPLYGQHQQLGVLLLESEETYTFSQQQIRPYLTMLGQFATAVENRELLAETITAKEEAEEAKEKADLANRAKSSFLANMSHELRTPLNGILGYTQILKYRPNLTPDVTDGLEVIEQSGEHLLTLITDVLDIAKIEAGKMELHPKKVYFPSFLRAITEIIRLRARQKKIIFIYKEKSSLPTGILADETRLRQILLNLLGNAVKFTTEGEINFSVIALNQFEGSNTSEIKLRFEIKDTGIGMTPEQLDKVFLPFEQVGDAKSRAEGTGLGLAISRKLAHAMQSDIQVTSTAGEGSTFWLDVAFPVVTIDDEIQPSQSNYKEITGYHGVSRKILVVDDKLHNRLVLKHLLEPLAFDLIFAENGQEAVDKAQQEKPDLILMDLVMPVLTGFEATKIIRQTSEIKNVPIIAISASVLEEDQVNSIKSGCDDFLPKPLNIEMLLVLLQHYLKITWVYQEEITPTVDKLPKEARELTQGKEKIAQTFVPPPQKELTRLLDLAMSGYMPGIRKRATEIEQMNIKYKPFADKLHHLAKSFEDEKILALITQYLDK